MKEISLLNVESELSYAYLHAVASQAKMSVHSANRHEDNNGIDAVITAWGPFVNGGPVHEVDLKVQLKATIATPSDSGTHLSYFLDGINRYNDLRSEALTVPRILVVLFLPTDPLRWLGNSSEELTLRRCAYWESLRGAPDPRTTSGTTVRLPKDQMFSVESLNALVARLSHRDIPRYPHGN